jgi:hypothetical protein
LIFDGEDVEKMRWEVSEEEIWLEEDLEEKTQEGEDTGRNRHGREDVKQKTRKTQ